MELIILNDGTYHLIELTKEMLSHIKILADVDCFSLCDIIRLEFTDYLDHPINQHQMKNGSGYFYGCICR
tara:strand:- start:2366 stop:2575 length:210 start_codon:yes stop_codon:yes gene_type:complete